MRSIRAVVPLALALGVVVAAPGAAGAKRAVEGESVRHRRRRGHVPVAGPQSASPGPSARSIARPARSSTARSPRRPRRSRWSAASWRPSWRGAKYVIRTTPPPPPDRGRAARARKAGDAPVGPTYASPPETAMRVLELQHTVAAEVDAADRRRARHRPRRAGPRRSTSSTTAVTGAELHPQRGPAAAARGGPRACAQGQEEGAVAPTFDILMPTLIPRSTTSCRRSQGTQARRHRPHGRRAPLLNAARPRSSADQGVREPPLAARPA